MKGFAAVAVSVLLMVSTIHIPTPTEFRASPFEPVLVQFHETVWELPEACNIKIDPGDILYGCYRPDTKTIHLPNPCYYPEAKEVGSFAYLACHEKGHANGWKH